MGTASQYKEITMSVMQEHHTVWMRGIKDALVLFDTDSKTVTVRPGPSYRASRKYNLLTDQGSLDLIPIALPDGTRTPLQEEIYQTLASRYNPYFVNKLYAKCKLLHSDIKPWVVASYDVSLLTVDPTYGDRKLQRLDILARVPESETVLGRVLDPIGISMRDWSIVWDCLVSNAEEWLDLAPVDRRKAINTLQDNTWPKWVPIYLRPHSYPYIDDPIALIINTASTAGTRVGLSRKDVKWLLGGHDNIEGGHPNDFHFIMDDVRYYCDYLELYRGIGGDIQLPHNRYAEDWRDRYDQLRDRRSQADTIEWLQKVYTPQVIQPEQIGEYEIFISDDYETWLKQARELSQCIVANKYYKKEGSTIIFIYKDGKPYATAEVREGKIVQAYGDERKRAMATRQANACRPAVEEFIKRHNIVGGIK